MVAYKNAFFIDGARKFCSGLACMDMHGFAVVFLFIYCCCLLPIGAWRLWAISFTGWCGVGVGVVSMYVTKVRVSKVTATTAKVTKVRAYPTGKHYHCFSCTSTNPLLNDRLQCPKQITIEQAEEQRLTPCKCKACGKTWKALS